MFRQRVSFGLMLVVLATLVLIQPGCGKEEKKEPEVSNLEALKARLREKRAQEGVEEEEESLSLETERLGTPIGGRIEEDTTLTLSESPYFLAQNLEIMPEVLLTVEPGVEIKAAEYTAIVVRGNFHAQGTPQERIVFTSAKEGGKWDGIQFKDESFDYESDELIEGYGCIIEYSDIWNARSGISCDKASPLIRYNQIQNCEEGIKCRSYSNPVIRNNLLKGNDTGIVCAEYSNPVIKFNTVIGNEGKGVFCVTYSSPIVEYNTIFGEGQTWWGGIVCQDASAPRIRYNNIYSNGGYNIKLVKIKPGEQSPDIDAQNNWWGTDDKATIAKNIFDKFDKTGLGEVVFTPYASKKIANANHKGKE